MFLMCLEIAGTFTAKSSAICACVSHTVSPASRTSRAVLPSSVRYSITSPRSSGVVLVMGLLSSAGIARSRGYLIQPLHKIPLRLLALAHGVEPSAEFLFLFRAAHQGADLSGECGGFVVGVVVALADDAVEARLIDRDGILRVILLA